MFIINQNFRQDIHKEVDNILNKLKEQERYLDKNGLSLSPDQVYHAFSGMSKKAGGLAIHYRNSDV